MSMSDASPDRATELLTKQADANARPDVEAAVIGLVRPGDQTHQGRLASAIGADQANTLASPDLEFEVLEDRVARVLPAEAGGGDEDHGDSPARKVSNSSKVEACSSSRDSTWMRSSSHRPSNTARSDSEIWLLKEGLSIRQ
jgi:hypothetical protein